jgi:hypothetical protein
MSIDAFAGALAWLEQTAFAIWVRDGNSLWGYPTIIFLHTLGMACVAGFAMIVDLRILGLAPDIPLAPMDRFFPAMWAGFWVNAVSGTMLFIADATPKVTNPAFAVKMVFVALGVVTLQSLRIVIRNPAVDSGPMPSHAKLAAATSLVCWLGAITAGRVMAYVGPVSGLPHYF